MNKRPARHALNNINHKVFTHMPMKLSSFIAFAAAGLLSLSACSESENNMPNTPEEESANYMEMLSRGQESACYHMDSFTFHRLEYTGSNQWEEADFNDWTGLAVPAPSNLTIHDGRIWTPLETFSSSWGPSPIHMPLMAYRKVTGFDKSFYIASPVDYNPEDNTIRIGKEDYEVESASHESMTLIHTSDFSRSTDNGVLSPAGKLRFRMVFTRQELSLPSLDNIMFYDSALEANLAIIEMLRKEFGDVFDLNKYLDGEIYLDHPVVDLDQVEQDIRAHWC